MQTIQISLFYIKGGKECGTLLLRWNSAKLCPGDGTLGATLERQTRLAATNFANIKRGEIWEFVRRPANTNNTSGWAEKLAKLTTWKAYFGAICHTEDIHALQMKCKFAQNRKIYEKNLKDFSWTSLEIFLKDGWKHASIWMVDCCSKWHFTFSHLWECKMRAPSGPSCASLGPEFNDPDFQGHRRFSRAARPREGRTVKFEKITLKPW